MEMEVFWNHSPLQYQRGFDHSGYARGRLQMADIGLHGTDEKGLVRGTSLAIDIGHSVDLDGITHRRSSPVRLQVIYVRCGDFRVGQRGLDHFFQRGCVRHG